MTFRVNSRDEMIKLIDHEGLRPKFVEIYGRTPEEYFDEYSGDEPEVWRWVWSDLKPWLGN